MPASGDIYRRIFMLKCDFNKVTLLLLNKLGYGYIIAVWDKKN